MKPTDFARVLSTYLSLYLPGRDSAMSVLTRFSPIETPSNCC